MSFKKKCSTIESSFCAEPEIKSKFKLFRTINCNTNTLIKKIVAQLQIYKFYQQS